MAGPPDTSPSASCAGQTGLGPSAGKSSPASCCWTLRALLFGGRQRPDRAKKVLFGLESTRNRVVTMVWRTKPGTMLSTGLKLRHHCLDGLLPLHVASFRMPHVTVEFLFRMEPHRGTPTLQNLLQKIAVRQVFLSGLFGQCFIAMHHLSQAQTLHQQLEAFRLQGH